MKKDSQDRVYRFAVWYVQECGFSVFPLIPGQKKPFKGWKWSVLQQRKPTDTELVSWFQGMSVNIAVVTGHVSGNLFVLDFDNMTAFEAWQAHTKLESLRVKTGKGVHVYFRCEEGYNGDFYVDGTLAGQARFDGGYVVAPPSVHPSGRVYAWDTTYNDIDVVTMQELCITPKQSNVLASATQHSAPRQPQERHHTSHRQGVKNPIRYAQSGLMKECQKIATTPEEHRNMTLFRTCFAVMRFEDVLSREEIQSALVQAACQSGLPVSEALKTVQSAWNYGR